jgi:hypothetical protein
MNDDFSFAGRILLVVLPILAAVGALVLGIIGARRKPPVTEEMYRDYATKADLSTLRTEVRDSFVRLEQRVQEERAGRARIHARIEDFQKTVTDGFLKMERAMGRVESKLESNNAGE